MYQALIRMMQCQNSPCIFFTVFVFFSSRVLGSEMWFSALKAVLFGVQVLQVRVFSPVSFIRLASLLYITFYLYFSLCSEVFHCHLCPQKHLRALFLYPDPI